MRILFRSAALCGAALFTGTTLSAATNPPPAAATSRVVTNAPIVVTASRAGRTVDEIPASASVITAEDIQHSGAQNVVEALESIGGLYFRHNSDNPGLADISMGGFGANSFGRVLVLVDGQRLNNADMSTLDWLRIPVGSVDRIEVLHGGQTALYGDYAVAGVINIITHQPSDTPVTTLSVMGGSYGTIAGHVGHDGAVSNVSYTADVDYRRSDGYRDNSQYKNIDVRASVSEDWTTRFSTTLSAFYTDNTYGMPGTLTRAQMDANPRQTTTPEDNAQTKTYGGNFSFTGDIGADGRLECAVAGTHRTISSDMYSWMFGSPYTDSTLDRVSVAPQYILDTDLAGYRNRLLVGVDVTSDSLGLLGYSDYARAHKNLDATLDRVSDGGFVQDEFDFSRKTALILGARGEESRYSCDAQFVSPARSDKTFRQAALDAALLYHPTSTMKLFVRAATLYRDPFLDEMTEIYYGDPMNLNLKPEVGQQLEAGTSINVAKEWTVDLSAYRLDMKDEIDYDPATFLDENIDKTRRNGVDGALTWKRQDVGLVSLSYNYVNAYFSAGLNRDCTIPLVPAQVLTLHGELELPFDLTALSTVRAVGSQYLGDDFANQGPKIPGYATLDLGLRYHPHQIPGLDILFGVDNVFDHTYANSGYYQEPFLPNAYYPTAGRMWNLGATYRF